MDFVSLAEYIMKILVQEGQEQVKLIDGDISQAIFMEIAIE